MTDHADGPRVAVVGATGAVGRELILLLEERGFPYAALRLLASERSAGSRVEVGGRPVTVEPLGPDALAGVDIAFFSAGGSISRDHAPRAAAAGTIVIDNSSAFRMAREVPLVVPEVNGAVLADWPPVTSGSERRGGIIANPNCSTIIALMAVTPLHRVAGVTRMVVSTYQAASGAGARYAAELEQQARDFAADRPYTTAATGRQYLFNLFSHDSPIGADGYNEEETKLVRETRKIWDVDDVAITATCIRVPVLRAHCESINLAFHDPITLADATAALAAAPGIRLVDDRGAGRFPEPIAASGLDDVLVGRLRVDQSQPAGRGLDLFVAGDQLRKGAALNAIQIAELLGRRSADPCSTDAIAGRSGAA